jgi:hypothetical protein
MHHACAARRSDAFGDIRSNPQHLRKRQRQSSRRERLALDAAAGVGADWEGVNTAILGHAQMMPGRWMACEANSLPMDERCFQRKNNC